MSIPVEQLEFEKAMEPLYVAVVCDVLDHLGYRHQTLPGHLRPLTPVQRICGRVFPAKARAVHEIPAEPYKLEIGAVEAMAAGDVLLVDAEDDRAIGEFVVVRRLRDAGVSALILGEALLSGAIDFEEAQAIARALGIEVLDSVRKR